MNRVVSQERLERKSRMDEVIIIRMEGNILSQTRDAINKKLEAGLVLIEAKVDDHWLQLIFKSSEEGKPQGLDPLEAS